MSDDTLKILATILVSVPVGTWIINFLTAWWKRQADKAKLSNESEAARDTRRREDEAARVLQRREDEKGAVEHYLNIIRMKDEEYDENRNLWYKERAQLLKERDRISAAYHELVVQATMMQDRLLVFQGMGSEGAERMDPILVLDTAATIRWANDPAGTFLGWPTLGLIGQPVNKIIAPDRHAFFSGEFQQIIARLNSMPEGYPLLHRYVGRARRRDGSVIKVCVIINGFRLYEKVKWKAPDGRDAEQDVIIPVFRVHLRQRWETSDLAVASTPIPLNSSTSSSGIQTSPVSIEPGADERDDVVVVGNAS